MTIKNIKKNILEMTFVTYWSMLKKKLFQIGFEEIFVKDQNSTMFDV